MARVILWPAGLHAQIIQTGNVTTVLGPTFFLDDATNGGTDTDYNTTNASYTNIRTFGGLLTRDQGPTRVTFTGFGFAAHTATNANTATNVNVSITYLGANGSYGGGDDVFIGTRSGTYNFTGGGEYVFAFDTPLTTNLPITERAFGVVINPNGKMKLKTGPISFQTNSGPRLSVAGVAAPFINPQRVNLAKFQAVTGGFAGQRQTTYLNDGVVGNDNRWQGENWAWNWAAVNFPFPVEIGSAHVFAGFDDTLAISNFSIQYLSGTNWITAPGASISGNTNVERNIVFTTPITASSFRILSQDASPRVRELALYPTNGPAGFPLGTDVTINLAYQRPAVANSFVAGSYPLNSVDGRTHAGSSWQTTNSGANTLDIEMVASTKIGSVHLYSGSGTSPALADFSLKSWNGTTWVDIPGGNVTANTNLDRVVTFTNPPSTTRVRLEFTKSNTTPTFVRELQIFPANTGNVGYALGTGINPSGTYASYETFNDALYRITNPTSSREVAVTSGGQPTLDPPGFTTAQAQYQVLLNLSSGTYRLRNRSTGNCLSGAQLSKTPGAALTDAPYVAMPHQDWILEPLGGGLYQIVNAWSGLVIDTQGGSTAADTVLVQNTASTATTQRWRFKYDAWAPKKGLGHGSLAAGMNAKWFYNWGPTTSATVPAETVFHPMQWGSFNWVYGTSSGPIWQHYPTWRKRGDGIHLMGFNEPDRTDQSNIPLAECVNLWPRLMALDQPLLSPSPGTLNPPSGPSWHQQFYDEAERLGYRVEYNAIHTYPGPSGGLSDNLINMLQAEFAESGRPGWLTEFSFVDWGGDQSWSEEDNYQTLAEFLWRAESLAALRKYALFIFTEDNNNPQPANAWQDFTPAPRSNSRDKFGNLTAFGKLYAAWDGDTTFRPDKTYYIHNKDTRKRLANVTSQTNPAGRDIRTDGDLVHWTLVPTGVANRYYVVSSLDGRRLSTTATSGAAGTVSLAAAGTTGTAVEWSLTPSQHGWHYLAHPTSTRRLQLAFNNTTSVATYTMATSSTTTDAVQWRFIVPPPTAGNTAPVLAGIATPQNVNEGAQLSFTASATDADPPAIPLFYSLFNAPTGATINSTTGSFTWTTIEAQGPGTFNFTVRVSDGYLTHDRSVTVNVSEVNTPPALATIPDQVINEGSPLTFTASATDTDLPANSLNYSLLSAPSGGAIGATSGVFTWTPNEAQGPGTFNFTVRVSDGTTTRDQPVTVTVNEVNAGPTLATIPSQNVNEGTLLSFTALGSDPDLPANTLAYSLLGGPAGATINAANGNFTWTPTEAQGPGTFNFTVRVSDGSLTQDRPVTVTVNEINTPPVLAAIPAQTIDEGVLLNFTAGATDTDLPANTLTYSLVGAPDGAAVNSSTGAFTWTPDEAQGPGTFNFNLRVSDGIAEADRPVSITVNEVNTAPALAAVAPQTVDEGLLLSFTAAGTDADLPANALTYSLVGAPAGAAVNPSTGAFTWTPTEAQGPGTFNFTLRVSDGTAPTDRPVTVTVNEINTAPELAAIPAQTVNKGVLLTFTASATDADLPANTLTYSLLSEPDGATINAGTGVFTWAPAEAQGPGTFNFTVRVNDGILDHDQPVSVNVTNTQPSATADPDGDGLSDLMEHAFVTDPAVPNANPFKVIGANTNNTVTLEFTWNWQAAGLSWQIRHGRDLSTSSAWPTVAPGAMTTVREGNRDRITISPAGAHPDGGLYRMEVISSQ